ncbi:hypothetical protein IAG44_15670 [Streptomyces roseirectus]|uniref:Secreted protein n=1 Tax=Streptomyces roseirectus TaxID=2768066 RepID=A0A7H0ID62_9ACTN|nr:hypothetical protein [Streptomyces roseirectus]QNP70728.1 hypothetical protein IAG44_15670 [Streptomyces roseirectus]
MASGNAGVVTGLTAAALVTVGVLGWQASATADLGRGERTVAVSSKVPRDVKHPEALPVNSGGGQRVVYSVDDDRVWLVGEDGRVVRTFRVYPGGIDPAPGSYVVSSRANAVTATDGTQVEHVVRFAATPDGMAIGFSAAVNGALPDADTMVRTGGIRETRADGDAMWDFATVGRRVVVIR